MERRRVESYNFVFAHSSNSIEIRIRYIGTLSYVTETLPVALGEGRKGGGVGAFSVVTRSSAIVDTSDV
jgi:hypothetical protein